MAIDKETDVGILLVIPIEMHTELKKEAKTSFRSLTQLIKDIILKR